jgi:hypothetical protein
VIYAKHVHCKLDRTLAPAFGFGNNRQIAKKSIAVVAILLVEKWAYV